MDLVGVGISNQLLDQRIDTRRRRTVARVKSNHRLSLFSAHFHTDGDSLCQRY